MLIELTLCIARYITWILHDNLMKVLTPPPHPHPQKKKETRHFTLHSQVLKRAKICNYMYKNLIVTQAICLKN